MREFDGWSDWAHAAPELRMVLPPATVDTLADVYAFAHDAHGSQTRPAGEPYVRHLLEVLRILVEAGDGDVTMLSAALLHDVVEDTDHTTGDVEVHFGAAVAGLVAELTHPADTDRAAYLEHFAAAPRHVRRIKLADRYSNVQRLHTHPSVAKQRSYFAETRTFFVPLARDEAPFDEWYGTWEQAYSYLDASVRTLEAAELLAAAAHREQVDKSGHPYISHPRAVAGLTKKAGGTPDQCMAALLHDVVEDTPYTLDQLRELGVPEPVVVLVDALSKRLQETHEQYLARVVATPGAALVKRADVTHNASPARLGQLDGATRERLRAKYAHALRVLEGQ